MQKVRDEASFHRQPPPSGKREIGEKLQKGLNKFSGRLKREAKDVDKVKRDCNREREAGICSMGFIQT